MHGRHQTERNTRRALDDIDDARMEPLITDESMIKMAATMAATTEAALTEMLTQNGKQDGDDNRDEESG